MDLYDKLPAGYEVMPTLNYYKAEKKYSDCVFIIFPGGGYHHLAEHEGAGYAKLFNTWGIDAFVLKYSVAPTKFPAQLNEARRSIQYVRSHAEEYGINPDKIIVIGSSAGGHLASMVSTYKEEVEIPVCDDISKVNFLPNYQVLCYSVIDLADEKIANIGSGNCLLGENHKKEEAESVSANLIADSDTPPAFIWHNADDNCVHVFNSIEYMKRLKSVNVPAELHIFPYGNHGLGGAPNCHCGQWTTLLFNWLKEMKIY